MCPRESHRAPCETAEGSHLLTEWKQWCIQGPCFYKIDHADSVVHGTSVLLPVLLYVWHSVYIAFGDTLDQRLRSFPCHGLPTSVQKATQLSRVCQVSRSLKSSSADDTFTKWFACMRYSPSFLWKNSCGLFTWVRCNVAKCLLNSSDFITVRWVFRHKTQTGLSSSTSPAVDFIFPPAKRCAHCWATNYWATNYWATNYWTTHYWATHYWATNYWATNYWATNYWTTHDWATHYWATRESQRSSDVAIAQA